MALAIPLVISIIIFSYDIETMLFLAILNSLLYLKIIGWQYIVSFHWILLTIQKVTKQTSMIFLISQIFHTEITYSVLSLYENIEFIKARSIYLYVIVV